MSVNSQFVLLKQDLTSAISKLSREELDKKLPLVELFLGEYAYFEDIETEKLNPVSELTRHFSEYSSYDVALFSLLLAEILTKRIEIAGKQDNLRLVNYGIGAINNSNLYFDKSREEIRVFKAKIKERDKKTSKRLNNIRNKELNELKEAAFSKYESTVFEVKKDNIRPTYSSISRRLYPKVEHLNRDKLGRKLIGRNGDPIGSLADILSKAVDAKKLKSPLKYR